MSINFDLQANGWIDDGTESGAIRTHRKSIAIVPVSAPYSSSNVGASINYYNGLSGAPNSNGSVVSVTVNQGTGNFAQIRVLFRGSIFGIAHRLADYINYSVIIDGVTYKAGSANPINANSLEWASQGVGNNDDSYVEMIATNLPNTQHEAEIIIPGIASGTNVFNIFGYALSRDAGYTEHQPAQWRLFNVTLTTTLTAISSLNSTKVRYVGKYIFYNSSASAVTVTVSYSGTSTVFAQSVPAGQSIEWVFNPMHAMDTTLYQVSASAASAITMTLIGRA